MTKRVSNEDMPATAISFKKDTLDVIREIADSEQRSLAAQIRVIADSWLHSPEGIAAIRKSRRKPFDVKDLQPRQSALTNAEDQERVLSELRELLAQYPSLKKEGED